MPRLTTYDAEVTLTVSLRDGEKEVASYSVTCEHRGASADSGVTPPAHNMSKVVEDALAKALAAERALRAGMQNAEARRLK